MNKSATIKYALLGLLSLGLLLFGYKIMAQKSIGGSNGNAQGGMHAQSATNGSIPKPQTKTS